MVLSQRKIHWKLSHSGDLDARYSRFALKPDLIFFQCAVGTAPGDVEHIQQRYNEQIPNQEVRRHQWEFDIRTGRVIAEALRDGPPVASVHVERTTETVKTPSGSYALTAHLSKAAGRTYLDFTDVKRR